MNLHGISTIRGRADVHAQFDGRGIRRARFPSSSNSAGDAQSTFISLLVTELQAQDPTQPMSPDQMVSQMFSMNQLEQLITINQTLTLSFCGRLTGATQAMGPPPPTRFQQEGTNVVIFDSIVRT